MENKTLFICGTIDQTKKMHEISKHLTGFECYFTPFYDNGFWGWAAEKGFLESTLLSKKLAKNVERYLIQNCLNIDPKNRNDNYDIIFTCSDQLIPHNINYNKLILVNQNTIEDKNLLFYLSKYFGFLRLFAGSSTIGLSNLYKFCFVPSESYKTRLVKEGISADKIIVTNNNIINSKNDFNNSEKFIAEILNEYFTSILRKYNKLFLIFTYSVFRNFFRLT